MAGLLEEAANCFKQLTTQPFTYSLTNCFMKQVLLNGRKVIGYTQLVLSQ